MTRQRGRWLVVALTFPGLAACAAGGAARPASVVAAVARYGDESKTRRGRPSSPANARRRIGGADSCGAMGLIWTLAAALWGVAEATVFFVVTDVLITYAAVRWNFS